MIKLTVKINQRREEKVRNMNIKIEKEQIGSF
jgi:hypothetical protein